jgi:hypothetical protein
MSDDPREITDDMLISELTVGEFKQLMQSLLEASASPKAADDPPTLQAPVTVRRKSLDEFMNDLNK